MRCNRCYMIDTRPGIIFKDGICQACLNYDKRRDIDWDGRLDDLYKKLKGKSVAVAVSGGKDSYFLCHMLMQLDVKPIAFTIYDHFKHTNAGEHNLKNLIEVFDLEHITFKFSKKNFVDSARRTFEDELNPLREFEDAIYKIPIGMAKHMKCDYIIYGEDSAYEYGTSYTETPDDFRIFMSHYIPWSSERHLEVAEDYGFHDLVGEWEREGSCDDFEQIDSYGYMIHIWLKFPKFGFQRVTDIASRRVREGSLTLEQAQRIITSNDGGIDPKALADFCSTFGYTEAEFWKIVESHEIGIVTEEVVEV